MTQDAQEPTVFDVGGVRTSTSTPVTIPLPEPYPDHRIPPDRACGLCIPTETRNLKTQGREENRLVVWGSSRLLGLNSEIGRNIEAAGLQLWLDGTWAC